MYMSTVTIAKSQAAMKSFQPIDCWLPEALSAAKDCAV